MVKHNKIMIGVLVKSVSGYLSLIPLKSDYLPYECVCKNINTLIFSRNNSFIQITLKTTLLWFDLCLLNLSDKNPCLRRF